MKYYLLSIVIALILLASCKKSVGPVPDIIRIDPQKGAASIPVIITGLHFDTVITHVTVKFNGVTANVFKATDSSLVVFVPAGATTGKVTVTINGRSTTSNNDFVILPGSWVQKANFPTNPIDQSVGRCAGIGFAIGNYGYIGFGTDNGIDFSDLQQYDPITNTWTQKASLGLGIESAICMVINNKAYVGIGKSRDISDFTTQFFEYNPSTDAWTRRADFPGIKRWNAFGMAIGGKGYVGLGNASGGADLYDVWQYDPSTDSWTQKGDFPHGAAYVDWPAAFVLGDSVGYITSRNYVWKYEPSTDTWTEKNNIPSANLLISAAMVINGNAHIVGGGYEHWQYDPMSDSWTQLAFFSDRTAGAAFAINGKGYYGTGSQFPGGWYQADLWQYQP